MTGTTDSKTIHHVSVINAIPTKNGKCVLNVWIISALVGSHSRSNSPSLGDLDLHNANKVVVRILMILHEIKSPLLRYRIMNNKALYTAYTIPLENAEPPIEILHAASSRIFGISI
jgi:hypothetical protein